jgi:hypothetical protein
VLFAADPERESPKKIFSEINIWGSLEMLYRAAGRKNPSISLGHFFLYKLKDLLSEFRRHKFVTHNPIHVSIANERKLQGAFTLSSNHIRKENGYGISR